MESKSNALFPTDSVELEVIDKNSGTGVRSLITFTGKYGRITLGKNSLVRGSIIIK